MGPGVGCRDALKASKPIGVSDLSHKRPATFYPGTRHLKPGTPASTLVQKTQPIHELRGKELNSWERRYSS